MAHIRMFLVSVVLVSLATGIDGNGHLMFSNRTDAVNVTRASCGQTELCVSEPDACDPAGTENCLFASILSGSPVPPNGTSLTITMRGNVSASGYIAIGLATNPNMGNTMVFICSGSPTGPRFFTRDLNNSMANANLTANEKVTKNITTNITSGVVRCQFTIPNVNSSSSTQLRTTNLAITLASGALVNGTPGSFTFNRTTANVDVSNPTALTPSTTAMPSTTSSSPPSFGSPVSLLLCVVLAWLPLLRM